MRAILFSMVLCCLAQHASAQCYPTITSLSTTTFCQGDSVSLVGSLGDTYQWYLNGNAISGATNDTFVANAAGSYTVIIDSLGCIDTSAAEVVTVNTVPAQPGQISGPSIACIFSTSTYTIAPVPGAISYYWYCSGGSLTGTTTSAQFQGTTISTNIFVTAINSCGNSLTSQPFPVTGGTPPTNTGLNLSGTGPLCPGDTKYMSTIVVHPGDIFTFYQNGNIVQSGSSQGYGATSSGSYYFIVTNLAGCSSQSNTVTVNFSAGPTTPVIIQLGQTLGTSQPYSSYTWYLNGNFVGTGPYCYPTQDGNYTVVVGNSVPCYAESAQYNVSYTNVEYVANEKSFSIYPNPNNGTFTLSANIPTEDRSATISIMDITGKVLLAKNIDVANGTIEEQLLLDGSLAAGLYFVKLSSADFNKVTSFVKQ